MRSKTLYHRTLLLLLVASETWYDGGGDGRNRKARLVKIRRVRIGDDEGRSLGVSSGESFGEENITHPNSPGG
ncbi:hypothetical protein L195_g060168 [Trifolium pratense]|uniref:Secreted protein n=1 Tax=Trifolium pratense TaxID=57577 RepID=A0A2K3K292_TRIPR|nr:hypothetical protein L195_g060168 [Trifolium pratense]